MMTFDVSIGSEDGKPVRLLVAADNWVEAWQDALAALGVESLPTDAVCVVEGSDVHVEAVSIGRTFDLHPLDALPDGQRAPRRGHPMLLGDNGDEAQLVVSGRKGLRRLPTRRGLPGRRSEAVTLDDHAAYPDEPDTERTGPPPDLAPPMPRAGRRPQVTTAPDGGAPASHAEPATEPSRLQRPPLPRPSPAGDQASQRVPWMVPAVASPEHAPQGRQPPTGLTPDPVARILSDLERQRLNARPIRLSSETGLPVPNPSSPPKRHATPSSFPRAPGAPEGVDRRRPRETTTAFVASPSEQLPQQFRPVQPDTRAPETLADALAWAADTAWQHVPCALALVLAHTDQAVAAVVAARGEREHESRGCRLPRDGSPPQLLCRAPTRVRFSEGARLRFIRPDDRPWDLSVESAMCVPVLPAGASPGYGLVLLNATRPTGFTDGEVSALTYLARTLAGYITG